jgi:8-oxo-dGTP pyrophosphatase MutT (NUDIX family)
MPAAKGGGHVRANRETENPWKTLSTSRIHQNAWFDVREDQVLRPDGQPGTYNVVSAARTATGILPVWPDGSLTLVGQYRYPIQEYSWEIPEGGGPIGENPESIARRELLEETGIQAESWEHLGRVHTSNCFVDEVCHLFLAKHLTSGPALPDAVEVLQVRRESLAEVLAMILDGRITDSISIAGVFRLLARLGFRPEDARY